MFKTIQPKRACALVVTAAAAALLWTACSDNEETPPEQPRTPSVELAAGTPGATTLTFTATSTDAEKCAYTVIEADKNVPTAQEILQGGGILHPTKA